MPRSKSSRGLFLGDLFEQAKSRFPDTTIELDHDLDVWPDRSRRLTYRELAELVADAAARLAAAGIRQDDRVAVYKDNNFDIVLLACALSRIGALPVMLSPSLPGDTVAALLARLDHPWLVTDASRTERLAGEPLDQLTSDVVLAAGSSDGSVDGWTALADLDDAPPVEPAPMRADDPIVVTHTSGTTGLPKLAMQTANTLWWRFRPQSLMAAVLHRGETVAMCLPFVHSRMFSGLGVILHRGLSAVALADPAPDNVAEAFARTRPSVVETLPNCFITWEQLADDPRAPLSNVACYSSTFDALHPRTINRLLGASHRRRSVMVQLYGQSETGPVAVRVYTRRSAKKADGRCLGISLPGMTKVRARTADGRRATKHNAGFLEARTNGRALTYLGEADRFARETHGPWWRMGDFGYRSLLGRVYLLDRNVDRIPDVSSNLEIEDNLLELLPELTEIVVVPDADRRPLPVVCTRDGGPIDTERWEKATAGMPPLAPPLYRDWASLPRTSTWKIKRLELARQLRTEGATATASAQD